LHTFSPDLSGAGADEESSGSLASTVKGVTGLANPKVLKIIVD
jgi:hypothetical protein